MVCFLSGARVTVSIWLRSAGGEGIEEARRAITRTFGSEEMEEARGVELQPGPEPKLRFSWGFLL